MNYPNYGPDAPKRNPPMWTGDIRDYSPDRNPSFSPYSIKDVDKDTIAYSLEVKGLGVVRITVSVLNDFNMAIFETGDKQCPKIL